MDITPEQDQLIRMQIDERIKEVRKLVKDSLPHGNRRIYSTLSYLVAEGFIQHYHEVDDGPGYKDVEVILPEELRHAAFRLHFK